MLDLEFADNFSKRANELFNDPEKSQAVLDEFESLDPREANIIYRTFSHKPGTVEHTHAKTRVNALLASGFISNELAALAMMEDVVPVSNNPVSTSNYDSSRINLINELSLPENKIYDPTGEIAFLVEEDAPKSVIENLLSKNYVYSAKLEMINQSSSEDDFATKLSNFQFKNIKNAVDELEDPENPVDFKEKIKDRILKYDKNGTVSELIDSGASSTEIFEELDSSAEWLDAVNDYATQDYVEKPRNEQLTSWINLAYTSKLIKSLDAMSL